MTLAPARHPRSAPAATRLHVHTPRADRFRALLRVSGNLDEAGARVLELYIERHLQLGRRFLRIDVAGLSALSRAGVAVLERAHRRLLSRRGTCIVVGATPMVMRALAAGGLDHELFVLPPSADESFPASNPDPASR